MIKNWKEYVISVFIIVIDIYILGTFDLFEPMYLGVLFLGVNYGWFSRYWKNRH